MIWYCSNTAPSSTSWIQKVQRLTRGTRGCLAWTIWSSMRFHELPPLSTGAMAQRSQGHVKVYKSLRMSRDVWSSWKRSACFFAVWGSPWSAFSARAEGLCFGLAWGIDQLGEGLLKLSISAHDVWYAVIQIVWIDANQTALVLPLDGCLRVLLPPMQDFVVTECQPSVLLK